MKKVLVILLTLIFMLTMSMSALAGGSDKANGNGNGNSSNNEKAAVKTNYQKEFKAELTQQKKSITKEKSSLEQEKEQLEAKYQELLAAGDTAGAEAILTDINNLDEEITALKSQIKQVIRERFMVAKTLYSEEELAQFENAAALIEQMYADADTLAVGSIIIKNNIIKFDAPPYLKGGTTLIPVRAITEGLGAAVSWDEASRSVIITKDDTTVVIPLGSTTVLVNDTPVDLTASAESTCSRVYVPLRFLAETFGLQVDWDEEEECIEIEDENADEEDADELNGEEDADDPDDQTDDEADDEEADSADEGDGSTTETE